MRQANERFLLIGHGAIALHVVALLDRSAQIAGGEAAPRHPPVLHTVLCRAGRRDAARAAFDGRVPAIERIDELDGAPERLCLAVECAGHAALAAHGPALLRRGIDLIAVSSGALADRDTERALQAAANDGGATLHIVSGAIAAIDALSAARVGGLEAVVYRAHKPPAGWRGSAAERSLDLDSIVTPTAHFRGSAREAASAFPKNANVAATVALAGIGFDRTAVELIVDPTISRNRHELQASGAFGQLEMRIDGNAIPGQPASSALTAMSVVRALQDRAAALRIG